MAGRFVRLRAALTLAIVAGGLVVIGGQSASGAGQNGVNNYAGPLSCADAGAKYGVVFEQCSAASGVDAQTSSTGAGLNVYEASDTGGTVTQTNQSGDNIAVCVLAPPAISGANTTSSHLCNFAQSTTTGNNTITADVQVTHAFTQNVGTGAVSQDASISLVGDQSSTSGDNTVRGAGTAPARLKLTETLTSNLNANVPADQTQESLMLAALKQAASSNGDNLIDLDLERDMTLSASAASPDQKQDVRNNNAADPNGRALVEQFSNSGTNFYRGRADDTKTASAQVLDNGLLGGLKQAQGHTGGGWLMQTKVDSPDNPSGSTVDLGTPPPAEKDPSAPDYCDTAGIVKKWTLSSTGPLGGAYGGPATLSQDDGITLPLIGKSPWTTTSYQCSSLESPAGTRQVAHIEADGHTKQNWTGAVAARLKSDQTIQKRIDFSDQDVHVTLDCTQNAPNACTDDQGGVTGSGTDVSASEGQTFSGQVASFDDADESKDASSYTAEINWGDGTDPSVGTVAASGDGFVVNGTHTYADGGSYDVTVTLKYASDGSEAAFFSSKATVGESVLGLVVRSDLVANGTFSGEVATLTDGDSSGSAGDYTAKIAWTSGGPLEPATIAGSGGTFTISGSHDYGNALGPQTITVKVYEDGVERASGTGILYTYKHLELGSFTIGDQNAAIGNNVTWWGNAWSTANQLSGGPAPSSFKGYQNTVSNPTCSSPDWATTTGNSPPPSSLVPSYMAVVVTSKVTGGNTPTGDIVKVVVVKVDPGYKPQPGSPGTGTVVAEICRD